MSELAINGGHKVRIECFPAQGELDLEKCNSSIREILESNIMSGYLGNLDQLYGGRYINLLEREFSKRFKVAHSIAINSCTSGLQIACIAIGLKHGDEVIVSPYSMSCSATAPLICGATPVFADVEWDSFCLDPKSIRKMITDKTKAIIVVDLFGQPYAEEIDRIAKEFNLVIIEDAAQAIGSKRDENYSGTLGDIGVFSFNQGKHISAGEGGMIVTNNDSLAMKCRLLMNHAEAVVSDLKSSFPKEKILMENLYDVEKMWGFNLRMTEITASIVLHKLRSFDRSLEKRLINVDFINFGLDDIPGICVPCVRDGCTHSYYVQPFLWKERIGSPSRDEFVEAVIAELSPIENRIREGVPIGIGYVKPIYKMPIFENRRRANIFLPEVEKLHYNSLFFLRFCSPPTSVDDCADVVRAFHKVWENRKELR